MAAAAVVPEALTDDLLENVTCPVCLEIPRIGGFFQCPNGHLICEGDFAKMQGDSQKLCPLCREPYVLLGGGKGKKKGGAKKAGVPPKSLLASCLLDMLNLPCRNSDQGCQVLLLRELLGQHEAVCPFNKSPCKYQAYGCQYRGKNVPLAQHEKKCRFVPLPCVTMTDCTASVPLPQMEAHLKTEHQKVQFWDADQLRLCFFVDECTVVPDGNGGIAAQHYPGHVINFDGRGFYLGFGKVGREWRIWASFIGAEQAAENYQVRISTHNPKRKGRQLFHVGPVNPPSTFGFDKLTSDVCALVVPSMVAERDLINLHTQCNKRVIPVTFQITKVQEQ